MLRIRPHLIARLLRKSHVYACWCPTRGRRSPAPIANRSHACTQGMGIYCCMGKIGRWLRTCARKDNHQCPAERSSLPCFSYVRTVKRPRMVVVRSLERPYAPDWSCRAGGAVASPPRGRRQLGAPPALCRSSSTFRPVTVCVKQQAKPKSFPLSTQISKNRIPACQEGQRCQDAHLLASARRTRRDRGGKACHAFLLTNEK
jgi:hypothetical protein